MCCKRLCDTARRLYTELNAGKTNSLEDFSAVWESTVSELKAYISAQETANEGKTVNTDDFQPALVAFKEKCASLDTAAVDDFERLSPIFKANMTDEEFKRLAARIEGFDFMGALALLEKEEQNV